MSQPTLSRLENAPAWRELARMGLSLIDLFCSSFKTVPERIVLDIDDTPDAVHRPGRGDLERRRHPLHRHQPARPGQGAL